MSHSKVVFPIQIILQNGITNKIAVELFEIFVIAICHLPFSNSINWQWSFSDTKKHNNLTTTTFSVTVTESFLKMSVGTWVTG